MKRMVGVLSCCLCTALVGCGGSRYGRLGKPVALPSGTPLTECEREGWYEIAPARVLAVASSGGGYVTVTYTQEHRGYGVFKAGKDEPENLEDVWSVLGDPELQRKHEALIQPVKDASLRSTLWSMGGLVGLFGGLGTAAAIQKQDQTGAVIFGVGGFVAGVAGLVGAIASAPSVTDVLKAEARQKLLSPLDDDMNAAAYGLDTSNAQRRRRCTVKRSVTEPSSAPAPVHMAPDAPLARTLVPQEAG